MAGCEGQGGSRAVRGGGARSGRRAEVEVRVEGKGFAVGLALVAVVLAVVFGLAVSSGASDDDPGGDCFEESC